MFGFVIPNKTSSTMCTHSNLKLMTKTKLFPLCEVIWMHDYDDFQRFGVITITRAEMF